MDHYLLNRLPNKKRLIPLQACIKKKKKKKPWKHGSGAISIIIDVLQSRLHTLAHTVLAMTAATEHDKFHNVEKKKKRYFALSGY